MDSDKNSDFLHRQYVYTSSDGGLANNFFPLVSTIFKYQVMPGTIVPTNCSWRGLPPPSKGSRGLVWVTSGTYRFSIFFNFYTSNLLWTSCQISEHFSRHKNCIRLKRQNILKITPSQGLSFQWKCPVLTIIFNWINDVFHYTRVG